EARDPPDLVVGHERSGETERDAPGRPGDQDLLVAQHPLISLDWYRRGPERTDVVHVVAMTRERVRPHDRAVDRGIPRSGHRARARRAAAGTRARTRQR